MPKKIKFACDIEAPNLIMRDKQSALICPRYDFEINWQKSENSGYVPEEGEMVIYCAEVDADGNTIPEATEAGKLPNNRTTAYVRPRIKIGDGTTAVKDLPFSNGNSSAYSYGTEELTVGVSELESGKLYFVYE